jgi:cell division protein ZipA
MNELRWILLAAGALLIVGLYVWGMRSRQRSAAAPVERAARFESAAPAPAPAPLADTARVEPIFSHDDEIAAGEAADAHMVDFDEPPPPRAAPRREPTLGPQVEPMHRPKPQAARPAEPEQAPEQAPEPVAEPGRPRQKIVAVRIVATPPARFEGARLQEVIAAEGLVYGRYQIFHQLHGDGRPIFSLASLREPGTFDLGSMTTTAYPGVALFAVLPGPMSAVETFDQLISAARAFAAQLNGTLADDRGAPLAVHRITRLREDMVAFERERSGSAAD